MLEICLKLYNYLMGRLDLTFRFFDVLCSIFFGIMMVFGWDKVVSFMVSYELVEVVFRVFVFWFYVYFL